MSRHELGTEAVKPELPITPMLDMSFQLLAFFILTFTPMAAEGQIALALPPAQPGEHVFTDARFEEKIHYVVTVTATEKGAIEKLTLREDGSPVPAQDLGAELRVYFAELKRLHAALGGKTAKLTLEMDEKLLQGYVVQLVDQGIRAGFTDLSPVPLSPRKR